MRQLLVLFLLFSAVLCHAQEFSGKVTDEKGSPVDRATVMVKGGRSGTVTNSAGDFRITLNKLPVTLVFSATGFKNYETKITSKTSHSFQVILLASDAMLEEVVVVGYGSTKRSSYYAESSLTSSRGIAAGKSGSDEGYRDYYSFPSDAPSATKSKPIEVMAGTTPGVMVTGSSRKLFDTITKPAGRSRVLTAGEVNDFKKWKMWEDFNETEFSDYSKQWGLHPTNRYTVQVKNRSHNALTGVKVDLIDAKTNDTVWSAVTDNTGKAELWAALDGKEQSSYLVSVAGKQTRASSFANGVNIIEVDKACGVSNKVQISFVVDATGSMGDEIAYLKEELEDIITKTFEKNESLDLEMSSVFYRDKGDEYVTRKNDFETDILKTVNFIKMQYAGGGGDYPEAVNDALKTAIDELKWEEAARARILFIILDAPPHNEAKAEMLELMKQAAAKGIRVVPIVCSGTNKSTEFLMRSIALATNGTYHFLTDHSGVGNGHIEPTTDSYNVELLNDLLQRTIEQMIYVADCNSAPSKRKEPVDPKYVSVEKMKVYPNPTSGRVTIETTKELREMYVADFSGKLLQKIEVNGKKRIEIDLTPYPSATYFIRYITTDGKPGAEKVILVH